MEEKFKFKSDENYFDMVCPNEQNISLNFSLSPKRKMILEDWPEFLKELLEIFEPTEMM